MMIKKILITSSVLLASQPTIAATKKSQSPAARGVHLSAAKTISLDEPRFAVNMQDGGFILKESTIFRFKTGFELNVERTYRSRSFQKGYFGQGWCSDFESSLSFQKEGVARLETCHSSRPLYFSLNKTASSYINQENSQDQIFIKLGGYERRLNNLLLTKYNFKGQLIEIQIETKMWRLKYDTRNLPINITSDGHTVSLKWHPLLNLVEKMELAPKSSKAVYQFRYEGFNLLSVLSNQGMTTYNYDDLDNMVLLQSPVSVIKMDYDKDQDQIRQVQSKCLEVYEFTKLHDTKKVSKLTRTCPSAEALVTRFEFDYKINPRLPAQVNSFKSHQEQLAQKNNLNQEL